MSTIEDAIRDRMEDLKKLEFEGRITSEEYSGWCKRQEKACRVAQFDFTDPDFYSNRILLMLWLIGMPLCVLNAISPRYNHHLGEQVFLILLGPFFLHIFFFVLASLFDRLCSLIFGEIFGQSIVVGSFWGYSGIMILLIPALQRTGLLWILLSIGFAIGIIGFLVHFRQELERYHRMKIFLDSISNYSFSKLSQVSG